MTRTQLLDYKREYAKARYAAFKIASAKESAKVNCEREALLAYKKGYHAGRNFIGKPAR